MLDTGGRAASRHASRHVVTVDANNEIVHGNRAITADTAFRLARYFGTTARFWLNLKARFDLEEQRDRLGRRLEQEVVILERAS